MNAQHVHATRLRRRDGPDTRAGRPGYRLSSLLSDSAQENGHRTAVVHGDEQISYQELDRISSQLAGRLVALALQPGDRVGILLPKSIKAVASIFAALKAGGVYVPLDPDAPVSRAAYIIKDCGIRHLVTTEQRLAGLMGHWRDCGQPAELAAVLADPERRNDPLLTPPSAVITWGEVERATPMPAMAGTEGEDLAYILYTSGSTGAPKGVMISHRAALSFIDWTHRCFEICVDDVVASHAPLHFDLSIFDIFTSVKAGATIALVPHGLSAFPIRLTGFIRDTGITVWYSVPFALVMMLTRGKLAEYAAPKLRLILFAGETFPLKYLRQLRSATAARMFNLYGPTETNVCTYYEVESIDDDRVAPIPVGTATAHYEVFALDHHNRPIGPGEFGELFARGPGLMSGYWGDDEKTNQVLVPNPLHDEWEGKVCRTGDIVTLDGDGQFVLVGRRDHMVKVRGHRVELGEVESVLYRHEDVEEAAVIAVPAEEVTNRLKAFVVCASAARLTPRDVQTYCLEHLPKYMLPETVEFREALPKTSTGKIDRQRLLAEVAGGRVPETPAPVASRGEERT